MRNKLVSLIDREIKNASEGNPAYIILKINNIVDKHSLFCEGDGHSRAHATGAESKAFLL